MRHISCHAAKIFGAHWMTAGLRIGFTLAAFTAAGACGGGSDAEKDPPANNPATGGTTSTTTGGGAGTTNQDQGGSTSTGTGGSTTASGGTTSPGTGGTTTGSCPARDEFTLGVHLVLEASWGDATGVNPGEGKIHIWNRTKFTASGKQLTGETSSCGTVLPPFKLNFIGEVAAGGNTILIQIPFEVWDKPNMPRFESKGTIDGWDPGSAIQTEPTFALVGLEMTNPDGAWPAGPAAFPSDVTVVDPDDDEIDGFLAQPHPPGDKDGNKYAYPPTTKGLGGPKADRLHLVSRSVFALKGTITSCEEQSGTVETKHFDSRVVACHVENRTENGGACTAEEVESVDSSPKHKISSGTFKSKQFAADTSCADIRAALPIE